MNEVKRAYDMLRGYVGREYDRVVSQDRENAYAELYQPSAPAESPVEPLPPVPAVDPKAEARRILGVQPGDAIEVIDASYHQLLDRSDPKKFDAGTEIQAKAQEIQTKIRWAYGILTDDLDSPSKRFRSLEIE
jgi:hypothetical protein